MQRNILVTGGAGFIGASIVKKLIENGYSIKIVDNLQRGNLTRLTDLKGKYTFVNADIRDERKIVKAAEDCDTIIHLAYVNGTKFFYSNPDLVLEIAVEGMLSVIAACKLPCVKSLFLASSSEVYQDPDVIPTPENVPLVVPDPYNPRYSYGGGKIICELLAIHNASKHLKKTVIFRPHNVYGPDMGTEHAVPEIITRMAKIKAPKSVCQIQGSGKETRPYMYIDDFSDAFMKLYEKGKNLTTYNIGNEDEINSLDLTKKIAKVLNKSIVIKGSRLRSGSTSKRCPDTRKLRRLGYKQKINLDLGLRKTADWYIKTP